MCCFFARRPKRISWPQAWSGTGYLVLAKPLSRQQAAFALRLVRTGRLRLQKLLEQNRRLTKRLDEAGDQPGKMCACLILRDAGGRGPPLDREKRAMDARVSSREIALDILKECGRGRLKRARYEAAKQKSKTGKGACNAGGVSRVAGALTYEQLERGAAK